MDKGHIVFIGTKDELLESTDPFVREFLGQVRGVTE